MSKKSKELRAKRRAQIEPKEARGYTPSHDNMFNLRFGGTFVPDGQTGGGTLTFYDRKAGEVRTIRKDAHHPEASAEAA